MSVSFTPEEILALFPDNTVELTIEQVIDAIMIEKEISSDERGLADALSNAILCNLVNNGSLLITEDQKFKKP